MSSEHITFLLCLEHKSYVSPNASFLISLPVALISPLCHVPPPNLQALSTYPSPPLSKPVAYTCKKKMEIPHLPSSLDSTVTTNFTSTCSWAVRRDDQHEEGHKILDMFQMVHTNHGIYRWDLSRIWKEAYLANEQALHSSPTRSDSPMRLQTCWYFCKIQNHQMHNKEFFFFLITRHILLSCPSHSWYVTSRCLVQWGKTC